MPNVEQTMHMGILRSADTEQSATKENIKKARKTLYSLISFGLHVLIYCMEVVLPRQKNMDLLEKLNKKFLKLILSLPVNTSVPAVYVLSGMLPIEEIIHKRTLTFFGIICRLPETTIEHRLAVRQLSVKSFYSHNWFIAAKGNLSQVKSPNPLDLLDTPLQSFTGKRLLTRMLTVIGKAILKQA